MLLKLLGLRHIAPVSIAGKTVWIIGASSGLGAALAVECAASGAKVVLSARRESLLTQVRGLLPGEGHRVLPLDVTDMPSFRRAFEQLTTHKVLADSPPTEQVQGGEVVGPMGKGGERGSQKIDYVIYNSGIRPLPEWERFTAAEQLEGLDVNLGGVLRLLELMIPQWQKQGGGNLLLIGSLIATGAMPLAGVYGASKAGLAYLAENLAMDLAPLKVQVQLASPGFIDTPLVAFRPRTQMPFLMPANKAAWKICKLMGREDVFEIHFPKPLSVPTKLARWLLPRSGWMSLLTWLDTRTASSSAEQR